jgi:hypothetical protein
MFTFASCKVKTIPGARLYPGGTSPEFVGFQRVSGFYQCWSVEQEFPLETELKGPSRRPVLIWLILSQALAVASLFFWLLMAGLSVMAFDSGVSTEAWTFVIVVWSYPLWPIAFAIISWIAYARHKDRLAAVLTTLTFLPMLLLFLVIVVGNFLFFLRYSSPF